jgi:hypothetical protein
VFEPRIVISSGAGREQLASARIKQTEKVRNTAAAEQIFKLREEIFMKGALSTFANLYFLVQIKQVKILF